MAKRSVIVDCDPGLDDAVALALVAAAPDLELAAITTVAGNASLRRVTENAVGACHVLGLAAPVYKGASKPLILAPHFGTKVWGGDGKLGLRVGKLKARSKPAAEHLAQMIAEAPEASFDLCLIAPLTNLAAVFSEDAEIAGRLNRLVIMGGALGRGNVTPVAEFNIWFDPHAARTVLAAKAETILVPYDVTRTVLFTPRHLERLTKAHSRPAKLAAKLLAKAGEPGHPSAVHDACAVAFMLWPDLFSHEMGTLSVSLSDGPTRGQTVFKKGAGRHRVVTGVDTQTLLDRICHVLEKAR